MPEICLSFKWCTMEGTPWPRPSFQWVAYVPSGSLQIEHYCVNVWAHKMNRHINNEFAIAMRMCAPLVFQPRSQHIPRGEKAWIGNSWPFSLACVYPLE